MNSKEVSLEIGKLSLKVLSLETGINVDELEKAINWRKELNEAKAEKDIFKLKLVRQNTIIKGIQNEATLEINDLLVEKLKSTEEVDKLKAVFEEADSQSDAQRHAMEKWDNVSSSRAGGTSDISELAEIYHSAPEDGNARPAIAEKIYRYFKKRHNPEK